MHVAMRAAAFAAALSVLSALAVGQTRRGDVTLSAASSVRLERLATLEFPWGALFYEGPVFPWRGSLVPGGLSARALIRLTLDGAKVTGEERIDIQRRIRDVIEARDGALLVLTDDQKGELLRVTPASATSR